MMMKVVNGEDKLFLQGCWHRLWLDLKL